MSRLPNFILECQNIITQQLAFADAWSALQQEFATFSTNGITIQDADVAALGVNAAQFTQALVAQQAVVDFVHAQAQAPKLYRVKR